MRDSAFFALQDVLRHCIHLLPLALYFGREVVDDGKQTSVLSSLLALGAAIEFFFYYWSSRKVTLNERYVEGLICSWSLSPVLLNLVLGGKESHSLLIFCCGVLPLACDIDTIRLWKKEFSTILLVSTYNLQLIIVLAYGVSLPFSLITSLVMGSHVIAYFLHYLTMHEKILLYSSYGMLVIDLFMHGSISNRIAESSLFSGATYMVVFEVAVFSLLVMLTSTVCLSTAVEYLWGLHDSFGKVMSRFVILIDMIGIISIGFVIPRLTYILGMNPFYWLLQVFIIDQYLAVYASIAWIITIIIFVIFADWAMIHWNLSKNHGRKIFHAMVVLMFVPVMGNATLLQFTSLSLGGACCIFILIEFIRLYVFLGRLKVINQYFEMFVSGDELKQKQRVILSHTSLLVGCALSIWIWTMHPKHDKILAYMGMISLGVGDAVAAVVGSLFGVKRWKESKKTYVGSIAALIAMMVFSFVIFTIDPAVQLITLKKVAITCLVLVFAEVMIEGNDNFTLPMFSVLLYMLL